MGQNEIEAKGVGAVWQPKDRRNLGTEVVTQERQAAGSGVMDLNLATLWRIIWQWRWLILSGVAIGLVGGVLSSLLTTPLYRSSTVLEINPPIVQVMGSGKDEAPIAPGDLTFLTTQKGLLESRALAERVAEDLNLASNDRMVSQKLDRTVRQTTVVNKLVKGLKIKLNENSRLIMISFTSPDPVLAARIVNGFANSFITSSLERRYQSSSYARDFLQRQIANVRRDLETSERQLVAYAQQQGIINTATGVTASDASSLTGDSLITMNKALADAQKNRITAEQKYRESLGSAPTAEITEQTSSLRAQRAVLQAEYDDKLNQFRPDYPEMVRLKSRIDSLSKAILTEGSNVRSGRVGTLRSDYQAAAAEEGSLRAKVAELRGEVLNLRGRSIQYNILQREVDTNRTLYDALLQRYKEIGVAGGVGQSTASIVDNGEAPKIPFTPNLGLNILLGIAGGFALSLCIALVLEFISDTIKTPDDVRNRLHLPFLGGIPSAKEDTPFEELRDASSGISEAYFSAATSLQFSTSTGAPTTLLVTSARAAEGKSTTSWALAQHFARLGRSVLLIDADMRKPTFVTGLSEQDGLSTLLTSRDALCSKVIPTGLPGLTLLPSGPIPPNPAGLLASPHLIELFAEANAAFDVVVIDGPPILGLADAPLLSMACRDTLMVVESGKTRTRGAVEALNRIREAGSNVVGAILTRYRHEASEYGYGYDAYGYDSVTDDRRQIWALTGKEP